MFDEINTLIQNRTWDLVSCHPSQNVVGEGEQMGVSVEKQSKWTFCPLQSLPCCQTVSSTT